MKNKQRLLFSLILLVVIFCLLFSFSQSLLIKRDAKLDLRTLATRVALDLEMLPIADPLFNYSGDKKRTAKYILEINDKLQLNKSRITVLDIVSVGSTNKAPRENAYLLKSAHKNVALLYDINTQHSWISYIVPVTFAIMAWVLFIRAFILNRQHSKEQPISTELNKPKLVVNLHTKCIHLSNNQSQQTQLANKPLCFYIALVEFCDKNADVVLNPNKEAPEALLIIANRYFERLTVLGHTVRKKPNFSSSLEKTLSEIRAALDEALVDNPDLKAKYYPPKAYGEGSRSKLHSYGLSEISFDDVQVIGK
ncbi:hypothetical protein PSECIP111951_00263 [Pseudoalteromonas holothuriae]|uniref:Uncharacterized protein n=1 Tax=Pseudoalteromonas holothuriae TaxID=2963714 RepID=A0ABM9GEE4_9GAMM|nr:hypothetical protein [Pseudoalteromonas sp. CIP111951]CAH9050781.1 hypothetical protein PSECIP111951_00263 [Pseudoalteromonas sp. CIP111951]